MLYVADRLTLWLAWIAASSLAFTLVPTGPYGLPGWIAAVGPLLHRVVPRIGIRRMALLGLLAIGGVGYLAGIDTWLDLALPAAVYLFGLLLAPVPITGMPDPREDSLAAAEESFQLALAREVGRARRYERPLSLISAACAASSDLGRLREAIAAQVHVYAQLFQLGERLLVIVPELDAASYPALEQRLLASARAQHLPAVEIGCASFPQVECTASGLIETADRTRRLYDLKAAAAATPDAERSNGDLGLGRS